MKKQGAMRQLANFYSLTFSRSILEFEKNILQLALKYKQRKIVPVNYFA